MASESQIFDFETALERAVQIVFEATGVVAWTSADDPELRRERPRVEIQFIPGSATGHLHPSALDQSQFWQALISQGMQLHPQVLAPPLVHDAFNGTLLLVVITKADYAEHVGYRARVRHVGSSLIYFADPEFHELTDIQPAGCSMIQQPEENIYESRMTYAVQFCVRSTAWPVTGQP